MCIIGKSNKNTQDIVSHYEHPQFMQADTLAKEANKNFEEMKKLNDVGELLGINITRIQEEHWQVMKQYR